VTFGSLFAGIGGLDLGLERAGMRCIFQVENNPYCQNILGKRWPDVPKFWDVDKFCRRIHDCVESEEDEDLVLCPRCNQMEFGNCECIGTDQLLDTCGLPDLLVGGDPCQENSNARRSGQTVKASLGDQFIRIIEQLRPRLVLRENPSTVRKDAPWPWYRFRNELEGLGYAVGADYRRDRLFLLAELQIPKRQGLEGHERKKMAGARTRRQDANIARSNRWSAAPRVCGRVDRVPNRMDRLQALGNAVNPKVAEWIGREIVKWGTP